MEDEGDGARRPNLLHGEVGNSFPLLRVIPIAEIGVAVGGLGRLLHLNSVHTAGALLRGGKGNQAMS